MTVDEYFQEFILLQWKDKYRWLIERLRKLNVQVGSIADFGFGNGEGTLALMWELEACEGAGVDIDCQNIRDAQGILEGIHQRQQVDRANGIPCAAPGFLRQSIKQAVEFHVGDITKRTQLKCGRYDIAFCNCVLYHIWLDQGRESSAQQAIEEMARVVKLGGLVAAREPTLHTTGEAKFEIDFRPLFEGAGLRLKHIVEVAVECGHNTEYIYLEESAG